MCIDARVYICLYLCMWMDSIQPNVYKQSRIHTQLMTMFTSQKVGNDEVQIYGNTGFIQINTSRTYLLLVLSKIKNSLNIN